MIDEKSLKEFSDIIKKDYGVTLDIKSANQLAFDFLETLEAIIVEKKNIDKTTKKRKSTNLQLL